MHDDRHEYLALNGMRGIAAFAVMFYHVEQHCRPVEWYGFFGSGFLAVDLFFLLSGFVLSCAYDQRMAAGLSTQRFMLTRYIRLGPLVALGILLGLAQTLVAPDAGKDLSTSLWVRLLGIPFDVVMLPTFFSGSPRMFPLNPPEWSLFYEILANLIFVVFFRVLKRRTALLIFIIGDSALLLIAMIHFHGATFGNTMGSIPYGILRVLFSFFLGVWIQRGRERWWTRLPTIPACVLYCLLIALLAMPSPSTAYQILVVAFANPSLIMLGSKAMAGRRGQKLDQWLGCLSYPLYIVHMPIMFLLAGLVDVAVASSAVTAATIVIVATVLASILPSWFDGPIRSRLAELAWRRFSISRST